MTPERSYMVVAAVALVAIVALLYAPSVRARARGRLTPIAGVAFACVVAGIAFGDVRWLGYSLIGTGVALSIVDAVRRARGP